LSCERECGEGFEASRKGCESAAPLNLSSDGKKRLRFFNAAFLISHAFNQFPYAIAKVIASFPVTDEHSF
jgi:hypothetical protein